RLLEVEVCFRGAPRKLPLAKVCRPLLVLLFARYPIHLWRLAILLLSGSHSLPAAAQAQMRHGTRAPTRPVPAWIQGRQENVLPPRYIARPRRIQLSLSAAPSKRLTCPPSHSRLLGRFRLPISMPPRVYSVRTRFRPLQFELAARSPTRCRLCSYP